MFVNESTSVVILFLYNVIKCLFWNLSTKSFICNLSNFFWVLVVCSEAILFYYSSPIIQFPLPNLIVSFPLWWVLLICDLFVFIPLTVLLLIF